MKKEKNMNDIINHDILDVSPYDASFPAQLLRQAFELRIEESHLVTERIYRDVLKQSSFPLTVPDEGEEKIRLAVDASEELLQDYKDGVVKLATEKGHMVAQIRKNGKYGSKLPIKEETYRDGSSTLEVQNALQLQAIQDALVKLSHQIQAIDKNVKEVLVGQQNDRLGLYYSGIALYIEAYSVDEPEFRKQLVAQSLRALTDSVFQLTLALQSDVKYLVRHEYDSDKKNKYNLINEKISNINQSFLAIHQATLMKAAIYCKKNEMKALTAVLQEYERFIKGTIVSNAEILSQCTPGDSGKISGIWKGRANLQLDVSNIVKKLQNPEQVLYIEYKGGEENESI